MRSTTEIARTAGAGYLRVGILVVYPEMYVAGDGGIRACVGEEIGPRSSSSGTAMATPSCLPQMSGVSCARHRPFTDIWGRWRAKGRSTASPLRIPLTPTPLPQGEGSWLASQAKGHDMSCPYTAASLRRASWCVAPTAPHPWPLPHRGRGIG